MNRRELVSVFIILGLAGCCTYKGKLVSKRNAEQMKAQGMSVYCSGDKEIQANEENQEELEILDNCYSKCEKDLGK